MDGTLKTVRAREERDKRRVLLTASILLWAKWWVPSHI